MATSGAVTLSDVMAKLTAIDSKLSKESNEPVAKRARKLSKSVSSDNSPPIQPERKPPGRWADPAVIERVLYSEDCIKKRVTEVAHAVSLDYKDATEDSFVVVGLLSGCYMFMADLTRALTVEHRVDFMIASSYGLGTQSSANVKITKDLDSPIVGMDVLILDEMCDSGNTMARLKQLLVDRGAKSVRTCVFLDKASRRTAQVRLDYVGYECEDEFLVGYGMDWGRRFRSLPEICIVKKSAYENPA